MAAEVVVDASEEVVRDVGAGLDARLILPGVGGVLDGDGLVVDRGVGVELESQGVVQEAICDLRAQSSGMRRQSSWS